MSICFQSLRSSSAGNCLALWTATSSILVDCGVKVQREVRALLEDHARRAGTLDAVIVSHAHGDHMSYGALRLFAREGIPVAGDPRVLRQLREWHGTERWKKRPALNAFPGAQVEAGDFRIVAVEVPHAPHVPNFGFLITARDTGRERRIVVCTDLHDYTAILPCLVGADFVFIEANHDLELLRRFPNPASRYHLNNVKTASLLHHAMARGGAPRAVMLGHLSEERNRRTLAIGEVARMFERRSVRVPFHLDAAPARRPSDVIEI